MMSGKRKREGEKGEMKGKPICKYGEKCYRTNPAHLQSFSHPDVGEPSSQKAKRLKIGESSGMANVQAVPFLLSRVRGILGKFNTRSLAVGLRDILSSKMGDLQASVQFNYMVDIPWLLEHYPADKRSKPLLIVHGDQAEKKRELENEAEPFPNVKLFQARLPIAFGTHHSKMMFLLYAEGLRIVITTANLIHCDWDQKTQGVWISPLFPKRSSTGSQDTSSTSQFKKDLLDYLHQYGSAQPLREWKEHLIDHDMSDAGVHLIASVPGRHQASNKDKWGHMKLRKLLQQHVRGGGADGLDINSWPVIGQFSSIGSLGSDKNTWLRSEWLESLATTSDSAGDGRTTPQNTPLHLIFPTVENVRTSFEGYSAGGSLPYSWKTAAKQPYLKDFFCHWKSDRMGRSRASPHIKSYTRVSPDETKAAWFLMTSANLSKAAWGALEKNRSQLMIRSYEIGVLFLPRQDSGSSQKCFNLTDGAVSESNSSSLRLPFDLPLKPYTKEDQPWLWDKQYTKPDVLGGIWKP